MDVHLPFLFYVFIAKKILNPGGNAIVIKKCLKNEHNPKKNKQTREIHAKEN